MARGLLVVAIAVSGTTCRIADIIKAPAGALLRLDPEKPTSLNASSAYGATAPAIDSIDVINDGGGDLQWTASVKHNSPWVKLDPDTGTAGRTPTLRAFFYPAGLDSGTYVDTVVVQDKGGSGTKETPLSYEIHSCVDTGITVGDTLSASLTTADCEAPHRQGRFAKLYRFNGAQNDSVSIELTGAFDGYVILDTSLVATRPPLLQQDDCLGVAGDPCRYYVRLPNGGNYWIEVTSTDSGETGNFKLRLLHQRAPNVADSLDQRLAGDSTVSVVPGGVISETSIYLKAFLSDPDLGDTLQLQAEVQPIGTNFTNFANQFGPKVRNGSTAYVLVTGLSDNTSYHWRVRAADQTGRNSSTWKAFADPAFNVQAGHDPTFANQNQYQSDGTTVIAVGGDATSQTVVFKAQLNDIDVGDQLVLQVEAEPVGTAFDSLPSGQSLSVTTGTTATVTLPGLTIGANYHWQFRAVDNGGAGRHTAWTSFGGNAESATDFHVTQPPNKLVWLTNPGASVAGSPIPGAPSGSPRVAVQDQNGNTITTFTDPVTMAIKSKPNGGQVTLLGNVTVNAIGGVATFPNLIIDTAGTGYTLQASASTGAGTITSLESSAFTVTAAPATQLVFTQHPPSSVVAGATFTVKVSGEDQFGNVNTGFMGQVAMAIANNAGNPTPGTLSGTTPVNATAGVATFNNLRINKTGNGYTLRAASGSLTPDTSAAFSITPAPATHLAFTVPPSGAAALQIFNPPVEVSGYDSLDNLATSFTGSVTVAIGTNPPGNGVLSGTLTRAAVSGTASFNDLKIDKAGVGYTLTATSAPLPVVTSPAFTITPSSIVDAGQSTVLASPATVTACSSSCSPGASTASLITVTARDAGGNVVAGVPASINVTGSGNSGVTGTVTTNASGVATWTLNSTVASSIPAELKIISAVINSVSITKKDTVTVNPGPPVALEFTNLVGNTTAGAAINSGSGVLVRARDQFTNTATSFNGNVIMTIAAPAGGAFAPTSTNTQSAAFGIANFPNLRIYQPGTGYQLRASSGSLTAGLSNTFTINSGAPNRLAFTTQPTTTAVLARIDSAVGGVVVSVQDSVGNTVPFGGTVQVGIGNNAGGGTLTGGNAIAAPTGVATFGNLRINAIGTGYTLVTTSSGPSLISDQSNSFDIVTGPPAKLAFFQNPTSATAGATISPSVTVQIQDANGFLTTSNASVTVAITPLTGTTGANLSGTKTVAAVNGTATFNTLSIDSAGTGYRLNATSGTLTGATSSTFSINAGPANKLAFGQQPSTTTAGANISPPVTVRILDALGNLTSSAGTVNLAITAGTGKTGAHLTGGSATASGGIATFSSLTIDSAGTGYTLTGSSGSLTQAISSSFNVNAGTATQLVFTKQPTNTTAGAILGGAGGVVVTARDALGNTATGFTGNVSMAITSGTAPPGAKLNGTTPVAASAGVATFSDLSINKTGTGYTLTASASGPGSAVSATFNIAAGTATQLIITTQPSSSAQSGVALGTQPVVQVADANGNPVSQNNVTVTATIASGPGGSPSLSNATATTNASGIATFSGITITGLVGDYLLRFGASGLTPDTSTTVTLSPGAAAKLGITTQPSSSAQSGVAFTTQPVIQIQDASGNPVSQNGTLVTATVASGPGGSSLTNSTATTNASGTATFSGLALTGSTGSYTLSFGASGLTSVTSGTITISAGAATKLAITTAPSSSAQAGVALTTQPVIQLQDAGGNPVSQSGVLVTAVIATNPGGSPSLTSATATTNASGAASFSGLAINGLVGSYTLRFDASGLTSATSGTITLSAGPASKLVITTAPSSSAQAGVAFGTQPVLQLQDASGNNVSQSGKGVTATIATNPGGSPTLSNSTATTNASGAATFSGLAINGLVGSYTLSFGASGVSSATSGTITLNPGTVSAAASMISANPTTITVVTGSSTITVTALDDFGNAITGATVVLSSPDADVILTQPGGTTDGSGVTTGAASATLTGNKTIQAAINGFSINATATVTVQP